MKVLYSLVCEHASARADGRIDVHGVFHQLYAPGFPAQQDHLTLVVVLEWERAKAAPSGSASTCSIRRQVRAVSINVETDVSFPAENGAPPQTPLVLPLENAVFPAPGTYEFILRGAAQVV